VRRSQWPVAHPAEMVLLQEQEASRWMRALNGLTAGDHGVSEKAASAAEVVA
jgi:hypothetical protein